MSTPLVHGGAPVEHGAGGGSRRSEPARDGAAFQDALSQELRFSGHAEKRIRSRGVSLDPPAVDRLAEAVDQAEQRGSSETLILMDGVGFVVSVPNRTVITAHTGTGDRVYTNIDSTIVLGAEEGGR